MKSSKHLKIVAWIYLVLGLPHFALGTTIMLERWRPMHDAVDAMEAGLSIIFFSCGIIVVAIALIYFHIALAYFRTASGRLLFPGRVAVIFSMILGFPYGTAAGIYALYARKWHVQYLENPEPETSE